MDLVDVEEGKELLSLAMKEAPADMVEGQERRELQGLQKETLVLMHQQLQAGDGGIYK
jgi:hypothetical protein